jgi:phenylacetate 2-hydroxylase
MSIGLTMVSAGLDTVPGNLVMGLAYLSSPEGRRVQQKAYAAIKAQYPDAKEAWHKCLQEEKVPYVSALVKEVLRFWTVIPICLPRVSIKDIAYKGAVIPAGTTLYMNAYAANYDDTHFKDPASFVPERYLDVPEGAGTPHYAYGAGSRMCAGSHLANRELFAAYVRLISAFEIEQASDPKDRPIMDCMAANAIPTSLTMDPKPFKVKFKPRDRGLLEELLAESEMATKDL